MNMQPPIQTPSGNCYNDFRPPLPFSSPLQDIPKSPDTFIGSSSRDLVYHIGSSLNDSPFDTRFPTNQHFPLVWPCIEHFHNTDLDVQPGVFLNYENNGQLQDLIDYPESMPLCNGQVGYNAEIMLNDNHVEIVNWRYLMEQETYVDPMEPSGNELLANSKAPQSFSDVVVPRPIIQYQLPLSYTDVSAFANLASASQSYKSRMRWTPELHDAFVDAVNDLGGYECATPKGIVMRMKVQGLNIYQVKSHLQMLESQTNAEKNNLKPGQSKAGRPSYPDNKLELSYLDRLPSRVGTSSSSQTRGEIPHGSKGKQKVTEGCSGAYPHPEADEPAPPLMKRLN